MEVVLNINSFTLKFEGVDKLLLRQISTLRKHELYGYGYDFYIELRRSGNYENTTPEKKNVFVPKDYADLLIKFQEGDISEGEIDIVNQFIANLNNEIVILYDYNGYPEPPQSVDPEIPEYIEEPGDGNEEEEEGGGEEEEAE